MWGNPTFLHRGKSIEKNIEKREILTLRVAHSKVKLLFFYFRVNKSMLNNKFLIELVTLS